MYLIRKNIFIYFKNIIIFFPLITFFTLTFTSSAFAQFPNLKGLVDKAKEKIESPVAKQPAVDPQRSIAAPNNAIQQSPAAKPPEKPQDIQIINSDGNVVFTKDAFKRQWCNTIESDTLGPLDYKGVRPGDICGQPEFILDLIFPDGSSTGLNPNGIIMADLDSDIVRKKGFELTNIQLVYSVSLKKMYITTIEGEICKTSSLNSLNPNNSFRTALVSKYGDPDSSMSAYDVGKAQYDSLKKDIDASRVNAVSVQEAKKARDGQLQLESINNMLKNPSLKSEVAQLNWFYKGIHKNLNPGGLMIWEAKHNALKRSYCPSLDDQISFQIISSSGMFKKLDSLTALQNKAREVNNKAAPVPTF